MVPLLIDKKLKDYIEDLLKKHNENSFYPHKILHKCLEGPYEFRFIQINSPLNRGFKILRMFGQEFMKEIHYEYVTYYKNGNRDIQGRIELHFEGELSDKKKDYIRQIEKQIKEDKNEDIYEYDIYRDDPRGGSRFYFSLNKEIKNKEDLDEYLIGFIRYFDRIFLKINKIPPIEGKYNYVLPKSEPNNHTQKNIKRECTFTTAFIKKILSIAKKLKTYISK